MTWGNPGAAWLAGFMALLGLFQWEAVHAQNYRLAHWLRGQRCRTKVSAGDTAVETGEEIE